MKLHGLLSVLIICFATLPLELSTQWGHGDVTTPRHFGALNEWSTDWPSIELRSSRIAAYCYHVSITVPLCYLQEAAPQALIHEPS